MRDVKFRIISKGKIIGYERITNGQWEWMCPELNPDNGERWSQGSFPWLSDDKPKRDQSTWNKDKNGVDIYEGDILQGETKRKYGHQQDGIIYYKKIVFGKFNPRNDTLYDFIGFTAEGTSIQYMLGLGCFVCGNIHENPELLTK